VTAGCKVTLFHLAPVNRGWHGLVLPLCARPVVAHGLCAKHYADRIRLGGTP